MIAVRPPPEDDRLARQRLTRQASGRVRQRAHVRLGSAQRRTVPARASRFGLRRATVRCWRHRVNARGPARWYAAPRRGRPRQRGPQGLAVMVTRLAHAPPHAGELATCWTVARVGGALGRRPRLPMPRKVEPAKAAPPWVLAKAVVEAGPAAAILYGEASRVHLRPWRRALGCGVGPHRRRPTPGMHGSRARFGALHLRPGRWGSRVGARRVGCAAPPARVLLAQVWGAAHACGTPRAPAQE
jgi:transposase